MPRLPPDTELSAPTSRRVIVRVQLSCLMCGEMAGILEDRRVVRPSAPGSIHYDGQRLTCGRCGSILILGHEERASVIATPDLPAGPLAA